jgi:hypothetical protein
MNIGSSAPRFALVGIAATLIDKGNAFAPGFGQWFRLYRCQFILVCIQYWLELRCQDQPCFVVSLCCRITHRMAFDRHH